MINVNDNIPLQKIRPRSTQIYYEYADLKSFKTKNPALSPLSTRINETIALMSAGLS